ncbi:hypothetical protein [Caballeronia arationis]|uniref:hypothetical protein n=1 Tax=Caballeronia arationis TaxID=1777142 RepID=UPI000A5F7651|nr:hypothetical protein [Caballeronia arationis]
MIAGAQQIKDLIVSKNMRCQPPMGMPKQAPGRNLGCGIELAAIRSKGTKHLDPACSCQRSATARTAGPLNRKSYRQRTSVADLLGEACKLPELRALSFKLKPCSSANGQVVVDPGRK